MRKHTPGPWIVVRRRDGLAVAGCDVVLFGDPEERAADANLIAASPDMLEALDLAEFALSGRRDDSDNTLQVIRAAIAKAKGGG